MELVMLVLTDVYHAAGVKRCMLGGRGTRYTCADFVDHVEVDLENLLDADLFAEIINETYKSPVDHVVATVSLMTRLPRWRPRAPVFSGRH